MSTYSL